VAHTSDGLDHCWNLTHFGQIFELPSSALAVMLCSPAFPSPPSPLRGYDSPFMHLSIGAAKLFPVHDLLLNWSSVEGREFSPLELRSVAAAMLIYVPGQPQLSNVLAQMAGLPALSIRFRSIRFDMAFAFESEFRDRTCGY